MEKFISMNKKAQIWSIDIMAGMVLFLVGIIAFYVYSLNQPGEAEDNFEILIYEGKVISDNLMSSGYPKEWNSTNVVRLGITDENVINETKIISLYDMIVNGEYNATKNLLNTNYDYLFFLEGNSSQIEFQGIGKPGVNKSTKIDARNLIKTTRFTIYKNKTVPLYLYVWEE